MAVCKPRKIRSLVSQKTIYMNCPRDEKSVVLTIKPRDKE